jgi:hypothetical protein
MRAPGRRSRTGLALARTDAKLAWGVNLHTGEAGQVHESLEGADLIDPLSERPDLSAVVAVEPHGHDLDKELLVITRTITWAGDDLEEIDDASVAPPTNAETAAVHAALDYLGYTGPREIRLFLAVNQA